MTTENLIKSLSEVDSRARSNSHRIDRLEHDTEALRRLAISVEVLASEQKGMLEKLGSVDLKIGELEKLPRDRWNSLIGYVISSAVSSLITVLIVHFLGA